MLAASAPIRGILFCFPLLLVLRQVQRNALRANLVMRLNREESLATAPRRHERAEACQRVSSRSLRRERYAAGERYFPGLLLLLLLLLFCPPAMAAVP